jgi:hypothetical protein
MRAVEEFDDAEAIVDCIEERAIARHGGETMYVGIGDLGHRREYG